MNIAIITGRTNSEREISLRSAQAVKIACDTLDHTSTLYDFPTQKGDFLTDYQSVDFVFVMIHGSGWEDGQIAHFLDTLGLPYQCTSPKVLWNTIDKRVTKQFRRQHNIPMAQDKLVDLTQETPLFEYPCVIKALDQGSSVGVVIAKDSVSFEKGIEQIKHYGTVMIEEFLEGSECTVPILDNLGGWTPHVLPIIEIVPPEGKEFDFENKYNDLTAEICPARYDESMTRQIQDVALRAYQAVWCTQYGRIDMIITKDGPKCLEINTIPWFTSWSLFPKSAKVFWLDFPQLIQYLIDLKMKK